jgi:hypothetical protein
MSTPNDWNPEDGPPPTDDERSASRELSEALDKALAALRDTSTSDRARQAPPPSPTSLDTLSLVETAMRAHHTEHPAQRAQVEASVRAAVDGATRAHRAASSRRWYLRLTAAAAVLVLGVAGARALSPKGGARATTPATISRSVDDVFTQALGENAGSDPISRIDDARMRAFRSNLFARGGRAR